MAKRVAKKSKTRLPPRSPAKAKTAAQKVHLEPVVLDTTAQRQPVLPFSVVGVGASAGGYEAMSQLLAALPAQPDFALVVLQHLDPTHESRLAHLLTHSTSLSIVEIRSHMQIEPGKIYVLPSNASVIVEQGRFRLGPREPRNTPMPIDFFFRSLANEQQNRAIGVVLSGTGTDGTLGLQEIKGQGGITFVQDKSSSKYFGMPGSAVAAGVVDFILPPDGIARQLTEIIEHPYVCQQVVTERGDGAPEPLEAERIFEKHKDELKRLFALLRTRNGVDFSLYKPGTLNRRIMRRMAMHKFDEFPDYLKKARQDPAEVDSLFHDLLISVTGFFRDPNSFAALKKRIFPKILKNRTDDSPVRIWTCGCATGEEAYSLAIALAEFLEESNKHLPVQIFASDLNDRGIEKARTGLYHENILIDVSPERLRRFFVKVDGYYQVNKRIRDMCVFARQNVVVDPPFSNLDLISCRNVLIYLTPILQRRIMPVFHYALKPGGFLLLGTSETIGDSSEMFELVDKKNKIYAKKITAYRPAINLERAFMPAREIPAPTRTAPPAPPATAPSAASIEATIQQRVDKLILNEFSPASVVINPQMDVLQFRGKTAVFLEHQAGAASLNLLKMAREDLALDLRRAVNKAVQSGHRVEITGQAHLGGRVRNVRIQVHPLPQSSIPSASFWSCSRTLPPRTQV